jgi:hypothetical protein
MPHQVEVRGGVLEDECRAIMQEFFRLARLKKAQKQEADS